MATHSPIPVGIVTDYIPQLLKSYSSINLNYPSAWFTWSDDQIAKVSRVYRDHCHANMCYQESGYDSLITAVPKVDEISIAYQKMLVHGPFKAFADLVSLEQVGKKYFFHCSNLDQWPSNLLYNFCIATRVPIEHKELLKYWSELCKEGYDPTLAFLLSYTVGGKEGHERYYANNNHFWFDPASSWANILDGSPTHLSKSFKASPKDCRPSNMIWDTSQDYVELRKMTNEQISQFFGLEIKPIVEPPPFKAKMKKMSALQLQMFHEAAVNAQAQIPAEPGGGIFHDLEGGVHPIGQAPVWNGQVVQPDPIPAAHPVDVNWAIQAGVIVAPQQLAQLQAAEDDVVIANWILNNQPPQPEAVEQLHVDEFEDFDHFDEDDQDDQF